MVNQELVDGHSFYQSLGQRLENGAAEISPEECVAEYRAYQDELKRFLEESQPAFDQAARGEGKEGCRKGVRDLFGEIGGLDPICDPHFETLKSSRSTQMCCGYFFAME